MRLRDAGVVLVFALLAGGGVLALERAAAHREALERLRARRASVASQLAAARRSLDHAESDLRDEPENPRADVIRGIYRGFVDDLGEQVRELDRRLAGGGVLE